MIQAGNVKALGGDFFFYFILKRASHDFQKVDDYTRRRLARSTEGLLTSILVSLRIVSKYVFKAPSSCA